MKQLIIIVSLVLFSFYPLKDNQKGQPYLAGTDNPLILNCPDYLPTEHNINANPIFVKPDALLNNIDQNWYSAARDNIMKEEYNITYSEELKSYQSPNRANNIRFTYHNNGFTAKTMQAKIPLFDVNDKELRETDMKYETIEDWSVELQINNYELVINNSKPFAAGNKARLENEKIRIDYTNSKEGMRQDFIVKEKPAGDEDLRLIIDVSTKLKMNVTKDAVSFRSKKDGTDKMNYSSLKAWDANGKILNAYFDKQNDRQFAIRVIDKDAQYPVTVDPLSQTPDWTAQASNPMRFGFGLSSGDLNGDGFNDVVIGAPTAPPNLGHVFIYMGSPSGPSLVADKVITRRTMFGTSLSCRGDFNNDGYSDLAVSGSRNPAHIEVFYGSPSGIRDSADWSVVPMDSNDIYFGYVISSGGDVNGDGYSDLCVNSSPPSDTLQIGAYIYLGSESGLAGPNPSWTASLDIDSALVGFGLSASMEGDINGDGYDDLLIGGYGQCVLVYMGSSNRQMYDPPEFKMFNPTESFGYSVAIPGDVNSDGYDDIVVGTLWSGFIFGYYGSPTGPSLNYNWTYSGENHLGSAISSAGDFNNDGYFDFVASGFTTQLFFGSAHGLRNQSIPISGWSDNVAYGDLNNDNLGDILVSNDPTVYGYYGSSDRVQALSVSPRDTLLEQINEVCIRTLVTSQYNFPMTGRSVNYVVKGANPGFGTSATDSIGISMFCYTGHITGRDTIISYIENISDTAYVVWDYPSPIEILAFNSSTNGKDVNLSWSTSTELNNSGFEIQRSVENSKLKVESEMWSNIGFVKGSGTTNEPQIYSFTDKNLSTGKYKYRLKQIDFNGNFEYFELAEEVSIGIPDKFYLSQNYPNPFNPVTNLEFGIAKLGFVSLKVYDVLGRELITLVNEIKEPGYYKIKFNATDLASGVYFYRMTAGDFVAVKKFVVMK